jgi:DNA-binding HxlR family transcriptional regulator
VADPDEHAKSSECCPVGRCADLLSGKWTLLVIRDLLDGPRHFGELERSLGGISPRTLCDRLKLLTEADIVTRTYIKALPPRTVYELTDRGRALESVISVLRSYGDEWLTSSNDTMSVPH